MPPSLRHLRSFSTTSMTICPRSWACTTGTSPYSRSTTPKIFIRPFLWSANADSGTSNRRRNEGKKCVSEPRSSSFKHALSSHRRVKRIEAEQTARVQLLDYEIVELALTTEVWVEAFKQSSRSTHPYRVGRHPFLPAKSFGVLKEFQNPNVPRSHSIDEVHENKLDVIIWSIPDCNVQNSNRSASSFSFW